MNAVVYKLSSLASGEISVVFHIPHSAAEDAYKLLLRARGKIVKLTVDE